MLLGGGARDWINHKLIEIDGLRQSESDSSPNRLQTPATGRRWRPYTRGRGMTRRQGMSGDAPVTSALRAVCNF